MLLDRIDNKSTLAQVMDRNGLLPVQCQAIAKTNADALPQKNLTHWGRVTHISVAYRYRKSISIIELFVSIYIDIYRVLSN